MTDERKELIERWAAECGIDIDADTLCRYEGWREPMERFAALVRADALEEAAKVCDEERLGDLKACDADNYYDAAVGHCADAIRKLIQP